MYAPFHIFQASGARRQGIGLWLLLISAAAASYLPAADPALPRFQSRTPQNTGFIEKHLESRLPDLSLSSVNHERVARPICVAVYLDSFLREQIQEVNRTGWQVQITRAAQAGIRPLNSRPNLASRTVNISVTTEDISKLPSGNNFAFSYFWLGLLHELENAKHAPEFIKLSDRARCGTISRKEFVEREIQLECVSFSRALKTYRQSLIPLVRRNSGVSLDNFGGRWPARMTPAQARVLLNWKDIETHYEEWYQRVSPSGS